MVKQFISVGLAVVVVVLTVAAYPYIQITNGKIRIVDGKIQFNTGGAEGASITNVFLYTGVDQFWTNNTSTQMTVYAWGAGGGGACDTGGKGGAGGCAIATFTISSGQVFAIVVGQGGVGNVNGNTYGGGGDGSTDNRASGGGMSGVFLGTVAQSNAWIIAGGGGGGGEHSTDKGGGGGGTNGETGVSYSGTSGTGGSQTAGGSVNGSALQGGNSTTAGGGGGGGGYFGGGAGTWTGSYRPSGGGGSGFYTNKATYGSLWMATNTNVPQMTNSFWRNGAGIPTGGVGVRASNGVVIIVH